MADLMFLQRRKQSDTEFLLKMQSYEHIQKACNTHVTTHLSNERWRTSIFTLLLGKYFDGFTIEQSDKLLLYVFQIILLSLHVLISLVLSELAIKKAALFLH